MMNNPIPFASQKDISTKYWATKPEIAANTGESARLMPVIKGFKMWSKWRGKGHTTIFDWSHHQIPHAGGKPNEQRCEVQALIENPALQPQHGKKCRQKGWMK